MPQYASLAAPLSNLTRMTVPEVVKWTPVCATDLQALKEELFSPPVLQSPHFTKSFVSQTYASARAVGAVLSQTESNGLDHAVT